jgi:hypothetical protein
VRFSRFIGMGGQGFAGLNWTSLDFVKLMASIVKLSEQESLQSQVMYSKTAEGKV